MLASASMRDHQAPLHRFVARFFVARFFEARFFATFAPDARASDNPIAMACLRLFTFFLERPEVRAPALRSRIAVFTFFLVAEPYFFLPDFLAAI
jgi:hypothetical protein